MLIYSEICSVPGTALEAGKYIGDRNRAKKKRKEKKRKNTAVDGLTFRWGEGYGEDKHANR